MYILERNMCCVQFKGIYLRKWDRDDRHYGCMVCYGVVWNGVLLYGVVWNGVLLYGVVWCCCMVLCEMVRCFVWNGVVWSGVLYGVVWNSLLLCGMFTTLDLIFRTSEVHQPFNLSICSCSGNFFKTVVLEYLKVQMTYHQSLLYPSTVFYYFVNSRVCWISLSRTY